jgi:hypothetical protein
MSHLGRLLGYGQSAASSPPASSPPDPELTSGWEVYTNKQGEPLYGNKELRRCQFSAPLAQVQEQHIPVQARRILYDNGSGGLSTTPYGYDPGSMQDPFTGRGGLKRKQSRRKQSKRKRKQSRRKRMQSRRRS